MIVAVVMIAAVVVITSGVIIAVGVVADGGVLNHSKSLTIFPTAGRTDTIIPDFSLITMHVSLSQQFLVRIHRETLKT